MHGLNAYLHFLSLPLDQVWPLCSETFLWPDFSKVIIEVETHTNVTPDSGQSIEVQCSEMRIPKAVEYINIHSKLFTCLCCDALTNVRQHEQKYKLMVKQK